MQVEIITIGDEILIGQIVDSNSAWMAIELNKIGICVKQISSISDNEAHILEALQEAENRTDIILLTGGLGPTKDDITKKTLAKYFGTESMVIHQPTLDLLTAFFAKRNLPLTDLNRGQALVPDNCEVLLNENGTAPGMLFRKKGRLYFSMPGVPFEMMALMKDKVLPTIAKEFQLPAVYHKTIVTAGIGESFLADKLSEIEEALPPEIKLAYLPKPGMVRLRLTALGQGGVAVQQKISKISRQIIELLGKFFIADEDVSIEQAVLSVMKGRGMTLSLAESCTGGYMAHLLTQHAGSSAVFLGGGVVYSNALKQKILGVKPDTLERYGAVSKETVVEMAKGAISNFSSDYSIAVSGIAGPDGGTAAKPVGTVWIAVANTHEVIAKKFNFNHKRAQNIERSAVSAFQMLLNLIRQYHS